MIALRLAYSRREMRQAEERLLRSQVNFIQVAETFVGARLRHSEKEAVKAEFDIRKAYERLVANGKGGESETGLIDEISGLLDNANPRTCDQEAGLGEPHLFQDWNSASSGSVV
jgi:hypothetical protein